MDTATFVYVIYINSTAESVWQALTDGEITRLYWSNHRNASDWKVGSRWQHEDYDNADIVDIVGTVLESERPHRLMVTWAAPNDMTNPAKRSRVTYDIEEDGNVVRLAVTHDELGAGSETIKGISAGWPIVLSSLKTLLETREAMPPIWTREGGDWKRLRFGPATG